MDITPSVPAESQRIDSYWPGGFRINGVAIHGSMIVTPDSRQEWPVRTFDDLSIEHLLTAKNILDMPPEVMLLGCGQRMQPLNRDLRLQAQEHSVVLDLMDTGAACRTYNILLAEGRRVVAALIALPEN